MTNPVVTPSLLTRAKNNGIPETNFDGSVDGSWQVQARIPGWHLWNILLQLGNFRFALVPIYD